MGFSIYADNAATTPLDGDAYNAMIEIFQNEYGNPSQPYSLSRASKKLIAEARETIASCINASPNEVYFTSSGTESDNWALEGVAFHNPTKAIITSQIEHHAILRTCKFLEKQKFPVVYLPVTSDGTILPETLKEHIANTTSLVSIMLANNEIGSIQPIKELAEIAHSHNALFHTDAVQAVGHIPVNVKEFDMDMMSASAHKFNGPKGIGFLYIKHGTVLEAFMHGGSQEFSLRAGTENVALIVGMAIALRKNINNLTRPNNLYNEEQFLISKLQQNGLVLGKDFLWNGNHKISEHLPGLISLSFKGRDGEAIMHRLDLRGIMISTGAACNSVNTTISHVIEAVNVPKNFAKGTIRISFNQNSSHTDVDAVVNALLASLK